MEFKYHHYCNEYRVFDMKSQMTDTFYTAFITIGFLLILMLLFRFLLSGRGNAGQPTGKAVEHMGIVSGGGAACDLHSCGAVDPVSDPAYNMKEVIKVSLLLEDHLTQKNKRCKDCILKHLLQLIAYVQEGLTLAGDNVNNYPYMKESAEFYPTVLDQWFDEGTDNEDNLMAMSSKLREWRKKLMAGYFPISQ
jgi:hypothetical protein